MAKNKTETATESPTTAAPAEAVAPSLCLNDSTGISPIRLWMP